MSGDKEGLRSFAAAGTDPAILLGIELAPARAADQLLGRCAVTVAVVAVSRPPVAPAVLARSAQRAPDRVHQERDQQAEQQDAEQRSHRAAPGAYSASSCGPYLAMT